MPADDEDYVPPNEGGTPHIQQRKKTRRQSSPLSDDIIDVPLIVLRSKLLASSATAGLHQGTSLEPSKSTSRAASRLPREVLHNILLQACESNAIPTAQRASCVCRAWRDAVRTCAGVYRRISVEGLKQTAWPLFTARISAFVNDWCKDLETLSLHGCQFSNATCPLLPAALRELASKCRRLSSLDLSRCSGLRQEDVVSVLHIMLRMRTPDVETGVTPLRSLNLSGANFAPRGTGLDAVVTAALRFQAENSSGPVLETLIVEDCPQLTHLPLRGMCEMAIKSMRPVLASLRVLSLARSGELYPCFHFSLPRFQYAAPNLEILDLDSVAFALGGWTPNLSNRGMPQSIDWPATWAIQPSISLLDDFITLKPRWLRLKVCRLGARAQIGPGTSRLTDVATVAQLAAASTCLEEISTANCAAIAWNELLRLLSPTKPPLRVLDVSRSGGLQRHYTCDLASALTECSWVCDTLEEIDVSGNPWVTDQDAEALAACDRLRRINFSGTGVTEKGLLAILRQAQHRGSLKSMNIEVGGCRAMSRTVRLACALGPAALARSVGLI